MKIAAYNSKTASEPSLSLSSRSGTAPFITAKRQASHLFWEPEWDGYGVFNGKQTFVNTISKKIVSMNINIEYFSGKSKEKIKKYFFLIFLYIISMEWYFALPLAIVGTAIGMLITDIVTKLLSDKDPDAQEYWFSFFEDEPKREKKTIHF